MSSFQLQPTSKEVYFKWNQQFEEPMYKLYLNVLWHAITSSDTGYLHNALGYPAASVLKTVEGGKLLWHAINRGNLEMARMLVHAGVSLQLRGSLENQSFLHILALRKQEDLALLMIQHGADVNAQDANGKSVLYYAVQHDLLFLVQELLQQKATVFAYEDHDDKTCVLKLAAGKQDPRRLLELLIFSCEDIDLRNERAAFVAQHYIDYGTPQLLEMMLDCSGLPIDYANPSGWTLLHYAVSVNNAQLVELLLNHSANVNLSVPNNTSPLHFASFSPRSTTAIMLIEKGADIHASNDSGIFPIHVACDRESVETLQLLLQLGADINVVDKKGRTPYSLVSGGIPKQSEPYVIEHIALLSSLGRPVNESDIARIRSVEGKKMLFERCLLELEMMKQTFVVDNVSYFRILCESSMSLCYLLARHKNLVECFRMNVDKITEDFPTYCNKLCTTIDVAEEKLTALRVLKIFFIKIFESTLPYVVIDRIAFYVWIDEARIIEKNYYLNKHRQIDRKIDLADRIYIRNLIK